MKLYVVRVIFCSAVSKLEGAGCVVALSERHGSAHAVSALAPLYEDHRELGAAAKSAPELVLSHYSTVTSNNSPDMPGRCWAKWDDVVGVYLYIVEKMLLPVSMLKFGNLRTAPGDTMEIKTNAGIFGALALARPATPQDQQRRKTSNA